MHSASVGTVGATTDKPREKPMTVTREYSEDASYRTSPREIETATISQQPRSPDQFSPSVTGGLWPGCPANYGVQTKACYPSQSDRAIRGKPTTGTRVGIQTKIRGPRPIFDTIGRAPVSTVAPVSRLPANRAREMQPTTGGFES